MNSYEIRYEYGRENMNWAGHVESEYRETRYAFVDASTSRAAGNKLRKQMAEGGRVVSVYRVRRV